MAIDGCWFGPAVDDGDGGGEVGLFEQHYTRATQAALPFMHLDAPDPVAAAFEEAGFRDVSVTHLAELADEAAGATPPYLIAALT